MNRSAKRCLALAAGAASVCLASRLLRGDSCSFRDRTVLITGGSRGLGLEMARQFAAEGARIGICARSAGQVATAVDELRRQGVAVRGWTCDIRDAAQVERWIDLAMQSWNRIDVLVNNAGIIQTGPLDSMLLADFDDALRTHVWGPLHAIRAVLPHMRARGGGRIVNIASIGGKVSVPHLLPYCVSKFALVGLSTGLRSELARDGIPVTTVSPGLMRTGSPRNALFKGRHRQEYAWFSIADSLPGLSVSSTYAARAIIRACRAGRAEVVLGVPANLAVAVKALCPELTATLNTWVADRLPGPGGIGTRAAPGYDSFSAWSPSWLTTLSERAAVKNNEM
jgi:NAD(P)-dependent dehydrogenase (short-subunit alcohol dehydrogenase family)